MNREIKFRGITVSGEWVYGNYSVLHKDHSSTVKKGHYISNNAGLPFAYLVRPETVGQFITNNGNQDFYIGDLVINPKGRKHTVVIWDNLPCLHYTEKGRDFYSPMTNGFLANKKVIGSIHTTHDKGKEEAR